MDAETGRRFSRAAKAGHGYIQSLRAKAQAAAISKRPRSRPSSSKKRSSDRVCQSAVVYVPTYNPRWCTALGRTQPTALFLLSAGYVATSMFAFGAGVAMGAAWGYAWVTPTGTEECRYRCQSNTNINNNINRDQAKQKMQERDRSTKRVRQLQHNAEHRKGVAYRDQGTAQKFNRRAHRTQLSRARIFAGEATPAGRTRARWCGDRAGAGDRGGAANLAVATGGTADRGGAGQRGGGAGSRGGASQLAVVEVAAAAVPFKGSIVVGARRGAPASVVAQP